jgi:hypothetical protein
MAGSNCCIFTCAARRLRRYWLRLANGEMDDTTDALVWSCSGLHGDAGGCCAAGDGGAQQMSIGQNQSVMAAILQPVTAAPYQAEKVTRSVQTLSDGTVITHETRGLIARDAEGRMREDLNRSTR